MLTLVVRVKDKVLHKEKSLLSVWGSGRRVSKTLPSSGYLLFKDG